MFKNELNLDNYKKLEIFKLYTKVLNSIHLGQTADIFWHNIHNYNINYERYLIMYSCKT